MDQKVRASVLRMEPISNTVWNEIRKVGTVTGSFVFAGYQEDESDIDFLIPPDTNLTMKELYNHMIYTTTYADGEFVSFYVRNKDSDRINLLVFQSEVRYRKWKQATKWMKLLCKVNAIRKICKNKKSRVILFEALKQIAEAKIGTPYKWEPTKFSSDEDIPF